MALKISRRTAQLFFFTTLLMVIFPLSALASDEFGINSEQCKLLREKGKFREAVSFCKFSLEHVESVAKGDGSDDEVINALAKRVGQLTVSYYLVSLAKAYQGVKEFNLALPLLERALVNEEKVFGPSSKEAAFVLVEIASLYYDMEQYQKALQFGARGLEVREKIDGPWHSATATALNNLALTNDKLGRHDKAVSMLERAIKILEQPKEQNLEEIAKLSHNLGVIFAENDQYEKAFPPMERALQIREKKLGVDHPDTQSSRKNLAIIRSHLPDSASTKSVSPATPNNGRAESQQDGKDPKPAAMAPAKNPEDTCAGLSNGQMVRVSVKGQPQPQSALVLDAGNGEVSLRIMGQSSAAGKKIQLDCSAVR